MRIARSLKMAAVLGVAATMALTACTQKSQSEGGTGAGGGSAPAGPVKVAFVPKLQGVPYFEAMNAGGQKAAAALGNVQWLYQGPTQADAGAQADIVRSFIQQKVNTLIVAPNDPDSMAPAAGRGEGAGHPRGDGRHRRAQLGARGVRQPGDGRGHRRSRSPTR